MSNYYDNDDLGFNPFSKLINKVRGKKKAKRAAIQRPSVLGSSMEVGAKRTAIGFGTFQFALATVQTFLFIARPQVKFRVSRLSMPILPNADAITAGVGIVINNVFVGNKSQFANAGALPAEAFAPTAIGANLLGDTCDIGQEISIQVSTTAPLAAAQAITVTPVIFGDSVY
jgi:hypothetical protein